MDRRERVGILGGTFNPIHIAHLVAAAIARSEANLDRVLFVVANDPWQKTTIQDVSPAEVRFEAVEAALDGCAGFEASRVEIERGGPSYMVDTLESLGSSELFLIGGADSIATLATWHRSEEIADLAEILVVDRPGAPVPLLGLPWRVRRLDMPALDISSTDLRKWVKSGKSVDFLVPAPALAVYTAAGLYS